MNNDLHFSNLAAGAELEFQKSAAEIDALLKVAEETVPDIRLQLAQSILGKQAGIQDMLRDFGTSELGHTLQDGLGSAADWAGKHLGIDSQTASTGLGGLGGLAGAFLLSKLFNMDMPQAMMLAMVLGGGGGYLGGMLGQKRQDYQQGAKGMESILNYNGQNEKFPTPTSDPNLSHNPMSVQSIPQNEGFNQWEPGKVPSLGYSMNTDPTQWSPSPDEVTGPPELFGPSEVAGPPELPGFPRAATPHAPTLPVPDPSHATDRPSGPNPALSAGLTSNALNPSELAAGAAASQPGARTSSPISALKVTKGFNPSSTVTGLNAPPGTATSGQANKQPQQFSEANSLADNATLSSSAQGVMGPYTPPPGSNMVRSQSTPGSLSISGGQPLNNSVNNQFFPTPTPRVDPNAVLGQLPPGGKMIKSPMQMKPTPLGKPNAQGYIQPNIK